VGVSTPRVEDMTIPTLRGPGELLATLPHLLGFTPVESIVIVGIREGGEIGAVMRVDRDDCLMAEVCESMARSIAAHLTRDGAVAAILVSYTDEPVRVCCEAADALRVAIADVVPRVDAWAVSRNNYFSPGCADVTCCPVAGTAVPRSAPRAATMSSGAATRTSTSHASTRRPWGTALTLERRRCARAADRWAARRADGELSWRRRSVDLWQQHLVRALDPEASLREADMGKLVAGMADVRVRDAVIVWLVSGSANAIDDVVEGISSDSVAQALDSMLDCRIGVALDEVQAAAVRSVLLRCISHGRRKDAAPLLCVLALVEWWTGEPGAALSFCDAASAGTPGYRLAALIRATILAGVMPGWLA